MPPAQTDSPAVPLPRFLKKDSLDELSALLANVPINVIRDWCSHLSVIPEGHCQHKASYSVPLLRKFWGTYLPHPTLELDSLRNLLSPNHDASGLPTTREGLLYDVLLSKF